MAKRVAEVEHGALTHFALVRRDDVRLDAATFDDSVHYCARVAREQRVDGCLQPGEKLGRANRAVLDDFRDSSGVLAAGERREGSGIDNHRDRLMKCADHVLAERMVDRGLSAYRRIDLREQGRRNLNQGHSALIRRRCETGKIPYDPASQRDQQRRALCRQFEQAGVKLVERRPVLMLLAVGYHDGVVPHSACRQSCPKGVEVELSDGRVGDHDRPCGSRRGQQPGNIAKKIRADVDRIAALGERDGQRLDHARAAARSCCSRRCASRMTCSWSDSMTKSAVSR